jgi:hypothetical protein
MIVASCIQVTVAFIGKHSSLANFDLDVRHCVDSA